MANYRRYKQKLKKAYALEQIERQEKASRFADQTTVKPLRPIAGRAMARYKLTQKKRNVVDKPTWKVGNVLYTKKYSRAEGLEKRLNLRGFGWSESLHCWFQAKG